MLDRTKSSLLTEQSVAQLQWLYKLHSAGLYWTRWTYPHLGNLDFEFGRRARGAQRAGACEERNRDGAHGSVLSRPQSGL